MAEPKVKEPFFKRISSLNLKIPAAGLELSHKYAVAALVLSDKLHLINTGELIKGNSAAVVNTNINANLITSNEEIIAVAYNEIATLYNYSNFKLPVAVVNAKAKVKRMAFNPTDNSMIAVLSEQGNLVLVRATASGIENWALNDTKVTALCFSPKGKQLCVGHEDGHLSQLKLDLTIAKRISCPGGIPVSILWVATTQFLILFLNGENLSLAQVDVQKAPAQPICISLGDVFISDVVNAGSQAYFSTQSNDLILCSSTTSNEIVVLQKTENNWMTLFVSHDERRANLPVDNFGVGGVLYYNDTSHVVFNESEAYPPMPIYIVASHLGFISLFSFINRHGKGYGAKFEAGLVPLDLSSVAFGGSERKEPPMTLQNPTSLASASLPGLETPSFAFNPIGASNTSQSVPPKSQPVSAAKTIPTLTPIQELGSFPGFGSSLKKGESQGNLNQSLKVESQAVPALNIAEPKSLPTESQINEVKSKIQGDQLSEHLLKQVEEFQARLANFQRVKATYKETYDNHMARVTDKLNNDILSQLNRMEDFVNTVEKTCQAQKKEVTCLRERNMVHFSNAQYVKSLDERNKDPGYLQTLRSQPLDSTLSKKFRSIERTVGFIRNQIQECRRHFYFSKYPPLSPEATTKFIYQTLASHGLVIQKLRNQDNLMREKVGLNNELDELTAGLKNTSIRHNGTTLSYSPEKVNKVKGFLGRRNIVKLKKEDPDYFYRKGDLVESSKKEEAGKVSDSPSSLLATALMSTPTVKPAVSPTITFPKPANTLSAVPVSSSSTVTQPKKTLSFAPVATLPNAAPLPSRTGSVSSSPQFAVPTTMPGLIPFSAPASAPSSVIQPTVLFPTIVPAVKTSSPSADALRPKSTSFFSGLGSSTATTSASGSLFSSPKSTTAVPEFSSLSAFAPPTTGSSIVITSVSSLAKPVPPSTTPGSSNLFSGSTSLFGGVLGEKQTTTAGGATAFSFSSPKAAFGGFGGTTTVVGSSAKTPVTSVPAPFGAQPKIAFTSIGGPGSQAKNAESVTITSTSPAVPAFSTFLVTTTALTSTTVTPPATASPVTVSTPSVVPVSVPETPTVAIPTTSSVIQPAVTPATTAASVPATSSPSFTSAFGSTPGAISFSGGGSFAAPVSTIPSATAGGTPLSLFSSLASATPLVPATTTPSASGGLLSGFTVPTTSSSLIITPVPLPAPSTTSTVSAFGVPLSASSETVSSSTTTAEPAPSTLSTFSFSTPATTPFGGAAFGAQPTASSSPFGSSTSFTPFGAPTTTAASLSTPTTTSGLFSGFGNICSPSNPPSNLFGSASSTGSAFGAPAGSPASIFGGPSTVPSATPSIFGAAATGSPVVPSIFGSPVQPAASPFGVSGGSVFGGPSTFGTGAGGASASPFGGASNTASSPFGAPNAAGSSPFGAPATGGTAGGSIFGGPTTFGVGSTFGGSAFGAQPKPAESIFGGNAFSGLGSAQPITEVKNVFGGGATFGQNANTSLFSSGSSPAPAQPFGSLAAKPVNPAFGAPSVFGSAMNTFGAAPTFGGGPVFGSSFGATSPNSVVGSGSIFGGGGGAAPNVGFGQLAQQNPGGGIFGGGGGDNPAGPFAGSSPFGGFTAAQPQQQQQQPQQGSSFGGGSSSFSSWR